MNLEKAHYRQVFDQNVAVYTRHFVFLVQQKPGRENRFGMILPKKKIPTAVQRNVCKRRIRESFRAQQQNFDGIWVIILAKPAAKDATKEALWDSINAFWQQLPKALSS